MRAVPDNALSPRRLPRATIPPIDGRLPVQARIIAGQGVRWVEGSAHAWTRDAVMVWWTDRDCLQRIDWLPARDIRPGWSGVHHGGVAGGALSGVDLKIDRAQTHRNYLAQKIRAWHRGVTHRLVTEAEDDGRTQVVRIYEIKPIPPDWPVVFGEFLFDLRSALDQLMWRLVVANGGKPTRDTAFPVFSQRDEKAFDAKVKGAHPNVVTTLARLQPYVRCGGDPAKMKADPLALLHLLHNRDKHRLTPIVAHLPERVSYLVGPALIGSKPLFTFQALHEGAELMRFSDLGEPSARVDLKLKSVLQIAVGETEEWPYLPLPGDMDKFLAEVRAIALGFRNHANR
jgi:hypothetical protein